MFETKIRYHVLLTENEFCESKGAIAHEFLEKLADLAKMEASLIFSSFDTVEVSSPEGIILF